MTEFAELLDTPDKQGTQSGAALRQYVTFLVDDRSYGVDINLVREIKQWTPTTTLPNQPHYTRGVLNLRGTIVPVHDLRAVRWHADGGDGGSCRRHRLDRDQNRGHSCRRGL